MDLRTLKGLAAQTAEEALRAQIAQVARAKDDDRLPRVRIAVGPHAYQGIPVRIEDKRGEPWLVLVDRNDVAYVPMRAVTTVVVEDLRVAAPPEARTRLVIERARAELETGAGTAIAIRWSDAGEDERRTIDQALDVLRTALASIRADELGRESLAAIERIELVFAAADQLTVARTGATLTITVGMAADLAGLRGRIEHQL